MVMAFILTVWNFLRDKYIKRKLPKDKKGISEYIELNEDFFKSKKQHIDKKEVEEDERRKREHFREFEKLRRLAGKTEKGRSNDSDTTGRNESEGRQLLQDEPLKDNPGNESEPKRSISFD